MMSWKDILKEDNVDKGFAWFMPKDKPKESKKNLLSQWKKNIDMSQVFADLEKGNVIVQVKSSEPSGYNNGTLTIGDDMLQGTDPKQFLEQLKPQLKQLPELEQFEVKDSSISGVPSLTITEKPQWNY